MPVYILPAFLSHEECETVRTLFPTPQPGMINTSVGGHVYEQTRRSSVSFLQENSPEKRALAQRVTNLIDNVNTRFHSFEIDTHEPLQLAEYRAEQEGGYGWHLDIGPGSAALRKLSASIQLSDPEDYDGGDLEIWGAPSIDRTRGVIIVFPSYLPHRVSPVTRGVRRSLVAWTVGKKPFR